MPSIESSNVRVEQGADLGSTQSPEKTGKQPQATATPSAAGGNMNALMTMRRQHAAPAAQPTPFVPGEGAPQPPPGRLSGMRRGLDSDAMQLFQMSLDMQRNRGQLLQQASQEMEQFSDSIAEGLQKAAR